MRGMGVAYNEVVISLIGREKSYKNLRKFTFGLVLITTLTISVFSATKLSTHWFVDFSGLSPALTELAKNSMWFALLMPGLNVFQSWFQGAILDEGKTRGITEAVIIFICTITIILFSGVAWNRFPGIYITIFAYSVGMGSQTLWLWFRSRSAFHKVKSRDISSELD